MSNEIVTQDDLNTWYSLTKELERVKTAELALRKKIFAGYFKDPKEGTNNVPLSQGWVLKGQHVINRKVDEATLVVMTPGLRAAGLPLDDLIRYKPDLATAEFRKLTDEQHKLFDQVLIITPGTPQMEIVLPKKAVKT